VKKIDFREIWSEDELSLLRSFRAPYQIQKYIDALKYSHHNFTRSPREVMKRREAHCFDAALFAAAALEIMGFPPFLVDLRSVQDTDHVIAIFKISGRLGSLAKSNFSGLRYREPVYKDLRELVMSYFEGYFNLRRERTLRAYSSLFDLRRAEDLLWRTTPKKLDELGERLDAIRHYSIMPSSLAKGLTPVDHRSFAAGKVGMLFKK